MTLERVQFIVAFWQRLTGRDAPKRLAISTKIGNNCGIFFRGEIEIHPDRATDLTVFHELAHLEQWQDGRLTFRMEPRRLLPIPCFDDFYPPPKEVLQDYYHCLYEHESGKHFFNGEPVDALPYDEQPAELEAQRIAERRLTTFRTLIYQNNR